MQVLFTAFEADPFMKTGGLADVAGSMPSAVKALDPENPIDIRVMLPKYGGISQQFKDQMTFMGYCYVDLAWRHEYCGIFTLEYNNITWYFLDNERYFNRGTLYGDFDDAERMSFFSKACLEACLHIDGFDPDIIHSNDWHTALTPVYLREFYQGTSLAKAKTVFTIHNLKFQGLYDPNVIADVCGLAGTPADVQLRQWRDYSCCANFLLGACTYADKITTVSPTYSDEICSAYYGEGLDWLFRKRRNDLWGILNGIDYTAWNPKTDIFFEDGSDFADPRYVHYDLETIEKKAQNKIELQRELGLEVGADIPVFAIISRLTEQKGLDLVTYLLPHIVESRMQLIVLGIGDHKYEEAFSWYAGQYPGKISAQLKFDNGLSHKLYAAADVMMIPSRFEPCGLTQLIAMRYGTLPLVRETGGLKDTVNNSNGFSFLTFNAGDMQYALDCALDIWYNNQEEWKSKQEQAMQEDYSWERSAKIYRELYQQLVWW